MKITKSVLAIIGRGLLITVAVLVILLSIGGIISAWYVNRVATDVTLKIASVVETGVAIADSGVQQSLTRVIDARSEIAQTGGDIDTLGQKLKENKPALTALSQRIETRLAPTIDKIQSVLEPVREGLVQVDSLLTVANSVPYFHENMPELQMAQDSLRNMADLKADVEQLRRTLREMAEGKSESLTDETTQLLLNITGRIDERLARTQSNLEQLESEIATLQESVHARKSRILLIINLTTIFCTLLFLWLIYSQIVVIRVQAAKLRGAEKKGEDSPLALDSSGADALSVPETASLPEITDPEAPSSDSAT
jgi:septal ring factor EnvC (AmiA/AmiB activator)